MRDKTQLHPPAAFDLSGFEIKYSPCNRRNCVLVKTASPGSPITRGLGLPPLSTLRTKSPEAAETPLVQVHHKQGLLFTPGPFLPARQRQEPLSAWARGLKNARGPGQGCAGDLCPSRDTAQVLAWSTTKLFLHLSNLLPPPPSSEDPSPCSLPPKCLCNSCE